MVGIFQLAFSFGLFPIFRYIAPIMCIQVEIYIAQIISLQPPYIQRDIYSIYHQKCFAEQAIQLKIASDPIESEHTGIQRDVGKRTEVVQFMCGIDLEEDGVKDKKQKWSKETKTKSIQIGGGEMKKHTHTLKKALTQLIEHRAINMQLK